MRIKKSDLRKTISRLLQEALRNHAPSRDSNWRGFADVLDIGVLDLDEIAYDLGFADFHDMDQSITPARLAQRDPGALVTAVQNHSVAALDMSPDEILRAAGETHRLPPGHPLEGQ